MIVGLCWLNSNYTDFAGVHMCVWGLCGKLMSLHLSIATCCNTCTEIRLVSVFSVSLCVPVHILQPHRETTFSPPLTWIVKTAVALLLCERRWDTKSFFRSNCCWKSIANYRLPPILRAQLPFTFWCRRQLSGPTWKCQQFVNRRRRKKEAHKYRKKLQMEDGNWLKRIKAELA